MTGWYDGVVVAHSLRGRRQTRHPPRLSWPIKKSLIPVTTVLILALTTVPAASEGQGGGGVKGTMIVLPEGASVDDVFDPVADNAVQVDASREATSVGLFDEPLQRSPRQFDPSKFDKRLGTAAATTSSAGKLSPRELVSDIHCLRTSNVETFTAFR